MHNTTREACGMLAIVSPVPKTVILLAFIPGCELESGTETRVVWDEPRQKHLLLLPQNMTNQ